MTAALQIDGLHKRFGSRQVLDGFSLQVARGEVMGLLGPNGCGKSTVLNIVCQLLQADAGQVQLMGEPLTQLGARARARKTARSTPTCCPPRTCTSSAACTACLPHSAMRGWPS